MNQNKLKFKIKQIEIIGFSLKVPVEGIPKGTVFRFDTEIKHIIDPVKKVIDVVSGFNIFSDDSDNELADAQVAISYQLENIQGFIDKTGKLELPEQFVIMLNSISISTCRGVMFALFRGTPLHSVVLPIIKPSNLNESGQGK